MAPMIGRSPMPRPSTAGRARQAGSHPSALLLALAVALTLPAACGEAASPAAPVVDAAADQLPPVLQRVYEQALFGEAVPARKTARNLLKRRGGEDGRAEFVLGFTYEVEEHYEAACQNYRRAARFAPDFLRTFRHLGSCHYYLGDLTAAHEALSTYLAARPDDGEALLLMGLVGLDQGRLDDARRRLEAALTALRADRAAGRGSPHQISRGLLALGDLHLRLDAVDAAVSHYEEALSMAADGWRRLSEVQYKLGHAYIRLDRHEQGRTLLRAAEESTIDETAPKSSDP